MPYDAMGSTPVFEAIKNNVPVFAVKENSSVLNVTPDKINSSIVVMPDYDSCLEYIINN